MMGWSTPYVSDILLFQGGKHIKKKKGLLLNARIVSGPGDAQFIRTSVIPDKLCSKNNATFMQSYPEVPDNAMTVHMKASDSIRDSFRRDMKKA
jgi:hypothetical protein